ncbi:MAG: universal stress protein [Gemmatimonadetes bacterium]|nr:universal stress protein [Gemmatimonadota bacterium]
MTLIVGLDPADGDLTPLRWARLVAGRFAASIEVVRVLQYEPPLVVPTEPETRRPPELPDAVAAAEHARVRALLEGEGSGAGELPISVRAGRPHEELAVRARELKDAVIVVGAGRRRWLGGLLGTTADRLLRTSEVPVLVVRGAVAPRLERVLAPVDFSPVSRGAAQVAVRWAQALQGAVVFFHVPQLEWRPIAEAPPGDRRRMEVVEAEQTTLERARARLAALVRELEPDGVRVVREFGRYGAAPADAIAARIGEEDVDLVVMGTHGRSGLERAILGSVAESVIHRSHVPVLVVPGRA